MTPVETGLLAQLALAAVAVLAALVAPPRRRSLAAGSAAVLLGLAGAVTGFLAMTGGTGAIRVPVALPLLPSLSPLVLAPDRLGGLFMLVAGAVAAVAENGGDVMARFIVRARELAVSAALAEELAGGLAGRPGERTSAETRGAGAGLGGGAGLGIVEAWRGTLLHRVELDATGAVSRVKIVDPSFLNWPALPVSLADTIVPDFPLANKSFNQSYAGNDL